MTDRYSLFFFLSKCFFIAVHIFVNTSCCIDQFHFSCIKGVGCIWNFKFYKRIFLSVFQHNCFPGLNWWFGYKCRIVRHISERYQPVSFRMYSLFHFIKLFNNFQMGCKIHNTLQTKKFIYSFFLSLRILLLKFSNLTNSALRSKRNR